MEVSIDNSTIHMFACPETVTQNKSKRKRQKLPNENVPYIVQHHRRHSCLHNECLCDPLGHCSLLLSHHHPPQSALVFCDLQAVHCCCLSRGECELLVYGRMADAMVRTRGGKSMIVHLPVSSFRFWLELVSRRFGVCNAIL